MYVLYGTHDISFNIWPLKTYASHANTLTVSHTEKKTTHANPCPCPLPAVNNPRQSKTERRRNFTRKINSLQLKINYGPPSPPPGQNISHDANIEHTYVYVYQHDQQHLLAFSAADASSAKTYSVSVVLCPMFVCMPKSELRAPCIILTPNTADNNTELAPNTSAHTQARAHQYKHTCMHDTAGQLEPTVLL